MNNFISLRQGDFVFKNFFVEKNNIVIAGGRKPNKNWLKFIVKDNDVYCADKGLEICIDSGFMPKILCGDFDSIKNDYLDKIKKNDVEVYSYEKEKDDTDLQLLLKKISNKNPLIVTGIWGGRFDHLYSNVFSLLDYKNRQNVPVVLSDDKEIMILLSGDESVEFIPKKYPKVLSVIPLDDSNITLKGTKWKLNKENINRNYPYAISNVVENDVVYIKCHKGCIGLYLQY